VVTDQSREIIEKLRESGVPAVVGDASDDIVLAQAHIAKAAMLIIATPDTMKVRKMVDTARKINPGIDVVIRSHSEMEARLLEQEETGKIFLGEHELASSISAYVLEKLRKPVASVDRLDNVD
jgi:CPA2 family monovalent cation:H+ antiporter-2